MLLCPSKGISLVVQWVRLCAPNAGAPSLILGQETKIPPCHMAAKNRTVSHYNFYSECVCARVYVPVCACAHAYEWAFKLESYTSLSACNQITELENGVVLNAFSCCCFAPLSGCLSSLLISLRSIIRGMVFFVDPEHCNCSLLTHAAVICWQFWMCHQIHSSLGLSKSGAHSRQLTKRYWKDYRSERIPISLNTLLCCALF